MVKTTIVLPLGIWRWAKERAIAERQPMRDVVIKALRAYLRPQR